MNHDDSNEVVAVINQFITSMMNKCFMEDSISLIKAENVKDNATVHQDNNEKILLLCTLDVCFYLKKKRIKAVEDQNETKASIFPKTLMIYMISSWPFGLYWNNNTREEGSIVDHGAWYFGWPWYHGISGVLVYNTTFLCYESNKFNENEIMFLS